MTKTWIKAATIRAVKTAAQTAIASIGATTVFSQVDWVIVGSTVLLATAMSYLTSIAGLPEAEGDANEQS